jgi:hypothetical protein
MAPPTAAPMAPPMIVDFVSPPIVLPMTAPVAPPINAPVAGWFGAPVLYVQPVRAIAETTEKSTLPDVMGLFLFVICLEVPLCDLALAASVLIMIRRAALCADLR